MLEMSQDIDHQLRVYGLVVEGIAFQLLLIRMM